LKTLEEPPPHVKFIFATTEPNKILPTILSRCQRFDLRPIPAGIIADQLLHIAKTEGVDLEERAAHAVARGADGGMRDAQSMLDQLVAFCGNKIAEADVLTVFGFSSHEAVSTLAFHLIQQDQAGALSAVGAHHSEGRDLGRLLSDLVSWFRALLVTQVDPGSGGLDLPAEAKADLEKQAGLAKNDRVLAALDILAGTEARMSRAPDKRIHLEIGLVKTARAFGEASIDQIIRVLAGADLSEVIGSPTASEASAPAPGVAVDLTPASSEAAPVVGSESDPLPVGNDPSEGSPDDPKPASEPVSQEPVAPEKLAVPEEPKGFHDDPIVNQALEAFDATEVKDDPAG